MIPFEEMTYHPTSEQLVGILQDKTQQTDALFFRVAVAHYFALAAAQMRCMINTPDRGKLPVNLYALNLAPSGYGKTLTTNLLEAEFLGQFRNRFMKETFPLLAEQNLLKIANERATQKGTDPDDELKAAKKEFDRIGPYLFSFDSGTSPAVKQMREKVLMANAGSMNLIMDEVGDNLIENAEIFKPYIEMFDQGLVKTKLIKNSTDNQRNEEILGKVPSNLLAFGVPHGLFDGAARETALTSMLANGYARRCFFGYVRASDAEDEMTAREILDRRMKKSNDTVLEDLADRMWNLADIINANKELMLSEDNALFLTEYERDCKLRAKKLPEHKETQKRELAERCFKALKLAGAYAFIDDSPEITTAHLGHAIKLAEDSGEAFNLMLTQDRVHVKLAKYIAAVGSDVTQSDLVEDLPFYRGSNSAKRDMLTEATAWGYKNNIIIKKSFEDGIEFLRGESLKETDLTQMRISYSTHEAYDYRNETAPFDKLHVLTQKDGMHWVNHHLTAGHRNEENAIPGFNMVVLDVEDSVSLATAKLLLKDYKFLAYTTKRHTEEANRYRILLPINFELKLDAKDHKEFMRNVWAWLPFKLDEKGATDTRSKKWMSHNGHFEYNEGLLLDALPFIPKTSKNEQRKVLLDSQQSMDNLERWVINNIGDGNRNNLLLRYAMILVDANFDFEGIRQKVMSLNDKIADKLDEAEIMTTILVSVAKAIAKRP